MRLIDADMLKDAMSKRVAEKRDLNASFYEVINEQPTVEAVPTEFHDKCQQIEIMKRLKLEEEFKDAELIRHGRWLTNEKSRFDICMCSACGEVALMKTKFCPYCGAKMDESDTYSTGHNTNDTITTVESNEDKLRSMLRDCRNELCLNCGLYKSAYQGACDNCRWASGKEWDKI